MTKQDVMSQVDGLPVRSSQAYAKEKLVYVAKYQHIFATGMKFKFAQRTYLDLLAGSGRCRIKAGTEEFNGSPMLSLDSDFTKRVFVEQDPELAAALRQRAPIDQAEIIVGDANDPFVIEQLRSHCPASGLALAFIDSLGMDVRFATLEVLTLHRKIDLLIVFQLQDFTRNIELTLAGDLPRERVDAFFGTPLWEDVVVAHRQRNASPQEITNALMEYYGERLKSIGYPHIAGARTVMKNSQNAAQYRLMLAARHERAIEFFRKIEAIDPVGQRGLF